MDARTRVVAEGYDVIADRYVHWRDGIVGDPRAQYLGELEGRLPDGARVLELGCGAGTDSRRLSERFHVVGVDVSGVQIERARANARAADFINEDITKLELEPASFDAVTAVYVLNHVPRDLLLGLFERVHAWLAEDGLFIASLAAGDTDGWSGRWLGVPMFFSGYDPDTNRRLLADAGFTLEVDELRTMHEPGPEGPVAVTFQWVLARR